VPVIELAHLTEAQKRAYILADNRLAEQAGWDGTLLALELWATCRTWAWTSSLGFEAANWTRCCAASRPARGGGPPVPPAGVAPGRPLVLGRTG
jgi:hypothetical protein